MILFLFSIMKIHYLRGHKTDMENEKLMLIPVLEVQQKNIPLLIVPTTIQRSLYCVRCCEMSQSEAQFVNEIYCLPHFLSSPHDSRDWIRFWVGSCGGQFFLSIICQTQRLASKMYRGWLW